MIIKIKDFNGAASIVEKLHRVTWREIEDILLKMPLHLKASEQNRIQGRPIFDPVGINQHIKRALIERGTGWKANIPIPAEYQFLGTDVDFFKNGILVEVQFSHYSFLPNNLVRCELFYKSKTRFAERTTDLVVIITKAHMFPASNSTLYYEQAVNQLDSLAKHKVFDVPIRVVGLFEQTGVEIPIKMTEYTSGRSRTVSQRLDYKCSITSSGRGRCSLLISGTAND